ncbi:MAG: UbiX family flavin prenyltransferase [Saprospiraceae bacterium]|nr:UbiX family flavin prenyltransferase [Saprospiraceae bacterium]
MQQSQSHDVVKNKKTINPQMKLVIGIGGASGSIYARVLLQFLQSKLELETHVVMSENAEYNWKLENPGHDIAHYPFQFYQNKDFTAGFASGSGKFDAMIICPCSAGLMGRIANGISDDLMTRAADVMLKERKKLVIVLRETPLQLIHIENMKQLTLAGAIICPAIPSFYSNPQTMDDVAKTVSLRALELVGIDTQSYQWGRK